MITLHFHGAASTVTGSKYLLETDRCTLLIDCGMFQGEKALRVKNWEPFPFDLAALDAVIITHTHIDHIGMLPRLGRDGYAGKIFCTPPTVDLARVLLEDTASLQEEDAEFRNKRGKTSHEKALPLFTVEDATQISRQLVPTPFDEWIEIGDTVRFRYHVAGHILGAASVEVRIKEASREVSILFSGDVGRYGSPLTLDPAPPPETDYLVCESTYGDKIHPPVDTYQDFADLIRDVVKRKSVLLIPAFAVGRTQQITHLVNRLVEGNICPPIDVHIDSPMAISATEIYRKYYTYHRLEPSRLGGDNCCLYGPHVFLHKNKKASKDLNALKGPAVILSASGMLTGGRILHHLLNRLDDPSTTVGLAGFMAEGTLGRQLQEGAQRVYIHKHPVDVRARVVHIGGLSGHGDYHELLHWLGTVRRAPQKVFLTHGEPAQSIGMGSHLRSAFKWDIVIPAMHERFTL